MGFDPGAVLAPLDVRSADEIVVDTIAALVARRPGWVARNASPEVIYLEAVSLAVAEVLSLGDQVIGGLAEALLSSAYKIPRLPGTQAVGTLTLTFDTTVTTTVPADTRFLLVDYGVELLTTAEATVAAATSVVVQVATVTPTATVNGVSTATIDLLSSVPNALSADLASTLSGGSEPEGDAEYIERASQRLARVTNSLVVPEHFSAYVLESGLASNASTIPAWDGTSIATAGDDGGHTTVACYGFSGQVSSDNRTALAAAMQAMTAAGVEVHVNEASLVGVDVTVDVTAEPGWDSDEVRAAVEAALTNYLNPATWEFGETVRVTSLITLIGNVDGVAFSDTPDAPAADVTLELDEVANVGTLTVSVT